MELSAIVVEKVVRCQVRTASKPTRNSSRLLLLLLLLGRHLKIPDVGTKRRHQWAARMEHEAQSRCTVGLASPVFGVPPTAHRFRTILCQLSVNNGHARCPLFHQVAILITESADTARANATGNHNHGGSSTGLFNDEMEKMDAVDATPANEEAVRVARNERLKRFQQQQLHHLLMNEYSVHLLLHYWLLY